MQQFKLSFQNAISGSKLSHIASDSIKWVAAVDGGGSKVAAALCKSNDLRRGTATTPLRHSSPGVGSAAPATWAQACKNISAAFTELLEQAGIRPHEVQHVVLMLAGAGRPDDVARVQASLAKETAFRNCANITITSDIQPLLSYARELEPHRPTIVAIAGTGSLVAAYDATGQITRAGGWGPLLGDEGSGWHIALCALQSISKAIDSGYQHGPSNEGANPNLAKLVEQFAIERQLISNPAQLPSALIALANDRHLAAQLAPTILTRAATSADSNENKIVQLELSALADQIEQVHRRIKVGNNVNVSDNEWCLALSGGLAANHQYFRDELYNQLHRRKLAPSEVVVLDPLLAALHFAARD